MAWITASYGMRSRSRFLKPQSLFAAGSTKTDERQILGGAAIQADRNEMRELAQLRRKGASPRRRRLAYFNFVPRGAIELQLMAASKGVANPVTVDLSFEAEHGELASAGAFEHVLAAAVHCPTDGLHDLAFFA